MSKADQTSAVHRTRVALTEHMNKPLLTSLNACRVLMREPLLSPSGSRGVSEQEVCVFGTGSNPGTPPGKQVNFMAVARLHHTFQISVVRLLGAVMCGQVLGYYIA